MKTFNNSSKKYNKQYATAYIVYMMAGSYFQPERQNGRFKNLYLHYAEMPQKEQYECESRVICSLENLDQDFLQEISKLRCKISCKSQGGVLLMEFHTGGFEGLSFSIQENGSFRLSPL